MRLLSLAVANWRGLDRAELPDLAPDLNLIAGPNESGKSRLFQALRYGIFERYKGESEDKKALRTWGSMESPRVTIAFEARGTTWKLEKQFLRQAFARLEGGGKTYTDDDAEARVRDLWGTRAIQGKKDIDQFLGLWPLLWVKQGDAMRAPHGDFNDDTRMRLRDALAAHVDEVAAGPEGERILARAERERERYWTATWKETGELASARTRGADAEAKLGQAGAARAEAHGAADELARIGGELASIATRVTEQRAIVTGSMDRVAKAKAVSERWRAHTSEAARLRAESDLAAQAAASRREIEARKAALEEQLRGEAEALGEIAARKAQIEAREAEEATRARDAESALEAAQEGATRARREAQRGELAQRAVAARRALERARAQRDRVAALKEALAATQIDVTRIKKLRKAHETHTAAKAALAAASAAVRVRAAAPLVIDGRALAAGEEASWTFDAPSSLVIEGIASIDVRPGGADLDARRDAERDAHRELDALLEAAGVPSLADAEEAHAKRTTLDAELKQAEPLLREAAPNGISALEDDARARDAELAALGAPPPAPASGDDTPPHASLERAEMNVQDTRDRVTRARAARDALKDERARFGDQTARREAAARDLARQRDEAAARLTALPPRDALDDAAATARARWLDADELAKALATDVQRAGGADADLRLEQDKSALARLEAEHAQKLDRKARLEAVLDLRGGEELHDRVQRAEAEATQSARDLERILARALASRALVEALYAARREVQERLLAPVLDRVQPYLQSLLPGARVRMDENWSVLGLQERDREEDFDALSGGAKEQVSILVRLALAEVLAQGEPLPIVLDDALVNTDDDRQADMLRILFRASRRQQILVFSCHSPAWQRLGETKRYDLPARRSR